MNVSAKEFNSFGDHIKRNALFVIEQIKLKEKQNEFDLVLDIGSGSGSMTVLLADSINCKKLIGLDIDDKMIEFAKQNNKRDNIDYLQCDVQLPWDQLSDEVKQLEGRCSLIYSSTALHWIRDIRQCVDNIKKFLAPGGHIYALMIPIDEMPAYQLKGEAKELETAIPLLKPGNFTATWKSVLTDSGLQIKVADALRRNLTYSKEYTDKFVVSVSYTLLMKLADNDEARRLVDKNKDILTKNVYDNMTIDEKQQYRYEMKWLFIVAQK